MNKNLKGFLYSLLVIILALIAIFLIKHGDTNKTPEEFHIHTDFKVYLDGEFYNFSQDKYMTTNKTEQVKYVHLHDMDGRVIHYHAENMNLINFFNTLGMTLNNTCFVLDNGTSYCNNQDHKLHIIVNNKEITELNKYKPNDLDRVLIAYTKNDENLSELFEQVSDVACIQSKKCPERGTPSDESSCAGTTCSVPLY